MRVERVDSDKKKYLDLLLLADPDEGMLDRYLGDGEMYVLFVDDAAAAEAVVWVRADGGLELKNLATDEMMQGRGYGSALVRDLFRRYADRYPGIYVGTAEMGTAFYERLGFRYAYTAEGFFLDNYPEPVIDNGVVLRDMIYLYKSFDQAEGEM